jgi:hypothetical protein
MSAKQLRCHRCGSGDLVLREAHLEYGEWQDGLVVNAKGEIQAQGEAVFNPGDPVPGLTEIDCQDCGHCWHPRREFTGAVDVG